jgi:hypothetical protein
VEAFLGIIRINRASLFHFLDGSHGCAAVVRLVRLVREVAVHSFDAEFGWKILEFCNARVFLFKTSDSHLHCLSLVAVHRVVSCLVSSSSVVPISFVVSSFVIPISLIVVSISLIVSSVS